MNNYKDRNCIVVDNGLFVSLAVRLAKDFANVFYYSPFERAFIKSNPMLVGDGLPGVTRVNDIYPLWDEVDLWVFPDTGFAGLQEKLVEDGKRVWGGRDGERLELYRDEARQYFQEVGIPVPKYEVVTGLQLLRLYLKEHDDQWVKISLTRGDTESFHSPNYKLIEPHLDELEHNLGAKKKIMEFVVEDAINPAVEIGYDGYSIDGQYPKRGMWGIEVKDKAYTGAFTEYGRMPRQLIDTNRRLAPKLKEYQYRNFLSTELRVTKDGKGYLIDPCCRHSSPPGELLQVMYTNLSDIIWNGAEGICVDPIPAGRWGAELVIHSTWATKNWQAIQFPEAIHDFVKIKYLTMIDGQYYSVPQGDDMAEIGCVVATGATLDEAIRRVKGYAKQIEGYYLDIFPETLDTAQEEWNKLRQFGVTT